MPQQRCDSIVSLVQDGKSCWGVGLAPLGLGKAQQGLGQRPKLSAELPEAAEFAKQIRSRPTDPPL